MHTSPETIDAVVHDSGSESPPLLITIGEAARLLSISRSNLYKLIGDGKLERRRIGGRAFIVRSNVVSFVERLGGGERHG